MSSCKFFCFRQNLHCFGRKNVFSKMCSLITLIQLLQLWKQESGIKWKHELILVSINASTCLWFQTHRISPLADFTHENIYNVMHINVFILRNWSWIFIQILFSVTHPVRNLPCNLPNNSQEKLASTQQLFNTS